MATSAQPPATRAEAALALRLAGAPYHQIATLIGYSTASDARVAVEHLLASTVSEEDKEDARRLIYARLDRLLQSCWSGAQNNKDPKHLEYARMVLQIEDRRAKLTGADAPVKHEVYTPTAQQILDTVAEIRKGLPAPKEADILDVQVIDDVPYSEAADEIEADPMSGDQPGSEGQVG